MSLEESVQASLQSSNNNFAEYFFSCVNQNAFVILRKHLNENKEAIQGSICAAALRNKSGATWKLPPDIFKQSSQTETLWQLSVKDEKCNSELVSLVRILILGEDCSINGCIDVQVSSKDIFFRINKNACENSDQSSSVLRHSLREIKRPDMSATSTTAQDFINFSSTPQKKNVETSESGGREQNANETFFF